MPVPRSHRTCSVLLLRSLRDHARSIGVDTTGLLRELGIVAAVVDDVDARVPDAKQQRAWAELERASGDDALGRIVRFYRLISDALAIEVVRRRDEARIVRLDVMGA
jgi:Arabinose-binding domain of AraC transcription regulator, N-term